MRKAFPIILCALCWGGCASHPQTPSLSESQRYYLYCTVNEMAARMCAEANTPESDHDIPRSLWPVEVQKLHPVRVYGYNWDVVIALRKDAREEEGYYFVPPCISMLRSDFILFQPTMSGVSSRHVCRENISLNITGRNKEPNMPPKPAALCAVSSAVAVQVAGRHGFRFMG
jgi:hypothetical protein